MILYHFFGRDRGYDIISSKKGYVQCLVISVFNFSDTSLQNRSKIEIWKFWYRKSANLKVERKLKERIKLFENQNISLIMNLGGHKTGCSQGHRSDARQQNLHLLR
jgi:hypothetical protein